MYKEVAIERAIAIGFGVNVSIKQMVAFDLPLSRTSFAQVFLTPDKLLYVYIEARSNLNVGDIKKLVSKMGLVADKYFPPKGRPGYFDEIATEKFKQVFPGRSVINDEDLAYYRTLVPYHPALIQVKEVKDGRLYQFDPDSIGSWRVNKNFSYRRIKTS